MTDWSLVGGDPAPGSPELIEYQSRLLRNVSVSLEEASIELSHIARGTEDADWRGLTADAMRDVLNEYRVDLQPVAVSFATVSDALDAYASDLEQLRGEASRALERAKLAKANIGTHSQGVSAAENLLRGQRTQLQRSQAAEQAHAVGSLAHNLVDPAASLANSQKSLALARESASGRAKVTETESRLSSLRKSLTAAQEQFDGEKATVSRLRDRWDEVSDRTAARIDGALNDSLKNRSNVEKLLQLAAGAPSALWDAVYNGDLLEQLRGMLEGVAVVLAIVTTILIAVVVLIVAPLAFVGFVALLVKVAFWVAVAKLVVTSAILIRSEIGGRKTDLTLGDWAADAATVAVSYFGMKGDLRLIEQVTSNRVLFNDRALRGARSFREFTNYEKIWHFTGAPQLSGFRTWQRLYRPSIEIVGGTVGGFTVREFAIPWVVKEATDWVAPGQTLIRSIILPAPVGLLVTPVPRLEPLESQ